MIKYEAEVVEIGPEVREFLDAGIVVLFEQGAPEELAEFSVLHQHSSLREDVTAGDVVVIGEETFRVTAVGEVVNQNLANLGHMIMKTNGLEEPELPGDLCVEDKPLPEISIGTKIRVLSAAQEDKVEEGQ